MAQACAYLCRHRLNELWQLQWIRWIIMHCKCLSECLNAVIQCLVSERIMTVMKNIIIIAIFLLCYVVFQSLYRTVPGIGVYFCTLHWISRHFQWVHFLYIFSVLKLMVAVHQLPSVLWRCWLGGRKGIRPVKNWVVGCWHGYLSGARCRLAYGPADATATHCLLLQ